MIPSCSPTRRREKPPFPKCQLRFQIIIHGILCQHNPQQNPMKRNFSISALISEGCNLMNKNWLMFIAIILIQSIISSILSPKVNFDANSFSAENIDALMREMQTGIYTSPMFYLSAIVSILFSCVTAKMAFDAIDGKKVSFDAFKMPVNTYLNYLATQLVSGFLIGIGMIFCLLPGIFIAVRLEFAANYVIDRGYGVADAIKASWHDTKGNFWGILGAVIVIGLFICVGYLACCVGAFYTSPAGTIALCVLARLFAQTSDYMPKA